MANDQNLEKNIQSAEFILVFFKDIQNNPEKYCADHDLLEKLSTQLKMGKLNYPDRLIFPSSMSTLKRVANKNIAGGFNELNKQRKAAHSLLLSALGQIDIHKDSKKGRRLQTSELKTEIQILRQDLFLRDGIIYKLFHLLKASASELSSSTRTEFFIKSGAQEIHRLGFNGSNINER